jgi:ABC-type dipeptide/oligopeptide/nickel transport system permease component
MVLFLARRLVSMLFVMFSISVLVFLIFFATPIRQLGSPAGTPTRQRWRQCGRTLGSTSRCPCSMG